MTYRVFSVIVTSLVWLVSFQGAVAQDRITGHNFATRLNELLNGKSGPYQVLEDDDDETRLLKQRINIAQTNLSQILKVNTYSGTYSIEALVDAQEKLLMSQLEFLKDPVQVHSAIKKALETYKQIEDQTRIQFESGKLPWQT